MDLRTLLLASTLAALGAGPAGAASPPEPSGELRCLPEAGASPFAPGREFLCVLIRPDGSYEEYAGVIRPDDPAAVPAGAEFHWEVRAPPAAGRAALAGSYRAAGAERALLGGPGRAVLRPLPEAGRWAGARNLARLIAELTLRPGRPRDRRPPLPPHPAPRP